MTAPAPYFAPMLIGGVRHEFGHLDPVRFGVLSEKLRRTIIVRCRFSNHVFTRAFEPEFDQPEMPVIMDGARARVFCPDRYRLSSHLPGVVMRLRDPRSYVRQTTARRNWLYVAMIEMPSGELSSGGLPSGGLPFGGLPLREPSGGEPSGEEGSPSMSLRYQVFFTLRKAAKNRRGREDVEMVVESAYAENPLRPPEVLGRALFLGLATAAVEGREVQTQSPKRR